MELQLKVQTYIRYKHAHHCTTKSQKHEKDCRRLFTNQIIAWDASGSKETELACHPWESSSRRGENSDKSLLSWGIFKDQEVLTACVRQWRSHTANVGCWIKNCLWSEWKKQFISSRCNIEYQCISLITAFTSDYINKLPKWLNQSSFFRWHFNKWKCNEVSSVFLTFLLFRW